MDRRREAGRPGAAVGAQTPSADAGTVAAGDAVLDKAVRRRVDVLRPERIYLFGSQARGDARPDSDYDFMVVPRRTGEGRFMERAAYAALSDLGVSKDVVVVTREYFDWMLGARASLPATVEREGRLLYAA